MEAVKTFNNELYSLNDYKPPISKAKMTQITKAAIKAIKFYKHVVQSVEKFIQKCKPEYKVPGLYVVDSIVRQSRHQFGQEKDVFAPRFSNNIINTFQNLYRCSSDDKSKIVRVLNLWQKNKVFKSEIIQPLLDMAAGIPPPVVTHVLPSTAAAVTNTPGTPATPVTPAHIVQGMPDPWIAQMTSTDTLSAVAQILQSPQGQQLQQLVQSLHIQQQKPQPSLLQALDAGLVVQLQALTAQLAAAASNTLNPVEQSASLSKKLIDRFGFGEANGHNEEPNREAPSALVASVNNSLFHQLAEHLQKQNIEHLRHPFLEQQHTPKVTVQEKQTALSESENSATPSQDDNHLAFLEREEPHHNSINIQQEDMEIEEMQDATEDDLFEKEDEKIVKAEMPRARSKSRSRSPRKRHSRSRSGSRRRKHRKHSRSRSRERRRKTSRSYSSERRAREREKERQKKGLPPIRSKTVSVCSTTLWVGQVDKKATQQDLTNVFEEFGQIESINMIPPRGCAYICMVHRQDAYRALQKLSAGACKIGSKIIKIAWALNKGVKTEYKQFWDVDLGVTYVPWENLKVDDLDDFAEGGMIDQETVNNDWSKQKITEATAAKETHLVTAPVPVTTVPRPVIRKSTVLTQSEAYSQPAAMLPIPVTPSVPAMSLVPPAFPVSMSVPPPGFSTLPPPPFMRAGFNPSQPPPGFIPPHGPPPNIPPISTAIQTALIPRLPISVESVKDISYGSLILPVGSVVTTSASTSSVFDPVSSTEAEKEDKRHPPTDNITKRTAADASRSTMVSSAGILSVQPQPPIAAPVPHLNMSVRMAGIPFLDIQPGLLSHPAIARFALSPTIKPPPPIRSILPPTLNDSALHSLPLPSGDIFPLPSIPGGLNSNVSIQDESTPLPSGSLQQEGDQDYRFPPVEVTIPSGGDQKKESLAVANKENKLVIPAEEIDIKMRHIQDDHDPQDLAVVDFDGNEKFPESGIGHLSVESSHEREREVKAQSLDSVRSSDFHLYESKLGNIHEFHDIKLKAQLEGRQQFGSSLLNILPKFGRHPQEIRKMFGRLPPEAHFGRLIPEGHISRLPIESKDQFGRPISQNRNNFGQSSVDGREHFSRPPLDIRDHFGRLIADGGRQQQFNSDKPWGHRGDFDERHLSFPGFSSSKSFQDERHVNYRPEPRSALGWNREFDLDSSRDFDDSHHPWERHRDRDDRDFAFRREVNGNRFGRVRQSNNWIHPHSKFVDFSLARVINQKEDDIPQVNGDMPDQPETIKHANNFELCEQESSDKVIKENDAKNAEVESQPVVESTENVEP